MESKTDLNWAANPADILDDILKRISERTGIGFSDNYYVQLEEMRNYWATPASLINFADTDWPMESLEGDSLYGKAHKPDSYVWADGKAYRVDWSDATYLGDDRWMSPIYDINE